MIQPWKDISSLIKFSISKILKYSNILKYKIYFALVNDYVSNQII